VLSDIHLIFGTLLYHTEIQIKVEFGFDPLIFHKVMALGLWKISQIFSFPHFFLSSFQIFISYLVHCFAIRRYRSSSSLVLIHWFFLKLWPNGLRKISRILTFPHFFFRALRYSFYIFYICLPYQDADQVQDWFWSIDLSPNYLEKYLEFSVFCTFFIRAFRFSFDIWCIALPYQDTDQV
jgi:hypothetical protein